VTPALREKRLDVSRKAYQRLFHAMPVPVPLVLHDSLTVTLDDLPANPRGGLDEERPRSIRANKCRGEEWRGHDELQGVKGIRRLSMGKT
jgi:hypothetical protein